VFGCTGAGLDGNGAEWCRASLGEDNAIDPGSVRHAKQRAQVLRILDSVEGQKKAGCRADGGLEQVFESEGFLGPNKGDHALMCRRSCKLGQLLAGLLAHPNTGLPAIGDQAGKPVVVALASNENVVKTAAARLKCLLYRMEAVENFHECSLDCR
jgi:hypothetical protein